MRRLWRHEIDATLASFIRGQGTVCFIQGLYYGSALDAGRAELWHRGGISWPGMISFIPYVGALVGGGLALGLALFQFWGDWTSIGM